MTEQKLWTMLRGLLPSVHWQRIETMTGAGVPDVNGCYTGREFWIELKIITGIKKLSFQSEFRPTQYAWMVNRIKAGGRCFVLGMVESGDEIWVWSGQGLEGLITAKPRLSEPTAKFARPFDRAAILSLLCGL